MATESKNGLTFSRTVPPTDPDNTGVDEYVVGRPATIERLSIRIYSGARGQLELTPTIKQSTGGTTSILSHIGDSTITGNNDRYLWELSAPVKPGEEIRVEYTNNGSFEHRYLVNMDIDYAGGLSRVLGGIL